MFSIKNYPWSCRLLWNVAQRTPDAIITSLLHQKDVVTFFYAMMMLLLCDVSTGAVVDEEEMSLTHLLLVTPHGVMVLCQPCWLSHWLLTDVRLHKTSLESFEASSVANHSFPSIWISSFRGTPIYFWWFWFYETCFRDCDQSVFLELHWFYNFMRCQPFPNE